MSEQPFLIGEGWMEVKDGNDTARSLFDRHYSRYFYADGRKPKIFVGPGEKLVLLTADARALCVWRKFKSADGQDGVNCAVFRNEGSDLASGILKEAMAIAWERWPEERLYTYIDTYSVTPTIVRGNPVWGYCFRKAGWKFCGVSKARKLIIMEAFQ
ncbi:hypothetical protein [Rhizobium favelukesii]|uniref:hypothetical protein n=1 Tax=Rhizobium favelukesii TaxID=348824 RepID=UPI00215EF3B2|nr:hypothetical protein [Rhizobium favelukesii]MCS0459514.1 hypothetical protein [Rhizobium favelukesii]